MLLKGNCLLSIAGLIYYLSRNDTHTKYITLLYAAIHHSPVIIINEVATGFVPGL